MSDEKQYGLILPGANKQKKLSAVRKLNPLQNSDDELENDDSSDQLNWVEASLKKAAGNAGQKSLQKRLLREALEEDASVFQYDEVYDDIQDKKSAAQQSKKDTANKKPKYIETILKTAQKRKIENERRTERNVQKERDAEGDMYADKEAFVTESYRQKLEELKKAEAEEKRERLHEEQIDVMKHKNFGVFYNHIFRQRMGETQEIKQEPTDDTEDNTRTSFKNIDDQKKKHYRTQRDISESPERVLQKRIKVEKNSDDDSSTYDRKKDNKYDKHGNKSSDRNRSRSRERKRSRSRDRRRSYRSRSRERRGYRSRSKENSKNYRSNSRERGRRHRSNSKENGRNHSGVSRNNKRKSRSNSKERNKDHNKHTSSSVEKHTKTKSKDANCQLKDIKQELTDTEDSQSDKEAKETTKLVQPPTLSAKELEAIEKQKKLEMITKLFSKRTSGDKFDEAVKRYFERKAERESRGG